MDRCKDVSSLETGYFMSLFSSVITLCLGIHATRVAKDTETFGLKKGTRGIKSGREN